MLSTHELGGVAVTEDQLAEMQAGDYILHARGGRLEKVEVEKIRLPRDPEGHTQRVCMVRAPNGTIYAVQHTLMHRSTDGGRTWEHLERNPGAFGGWNLRFDDEGTMLNIGRPSADDPPAVWASADEGVTWEQIAEIEIPTSRAAAPGSSVPQPGERALLVPIHISGVKVDWKETFTQPSGASKCCIYGSTDGGLTWSELSLLGEWCHEVNLAALPGGRVLAVIRYQRPRYPDDTPELFERTGAAGFGSAIPYKHVFVAHSDDGARTWSPLRQVTKVYGQCHGAGVGLSDGRVVVVHDHRYPRAMGSGRAMVSRDRGESWEDEVYYLAHGMAAGYARTISLDGDEMLTFVGSCYGDVDKGWNFCVGRSDFVMIRWRLA